MPSRITIECTHCGAKLSLADSSKLGKKIKCPKCSQVFVATSDEDPDDDFEDVEEKDVEDAPALRRGTGGPKKGTAAKGGKGKKGKKSGSNLGLILGGAAGVVVLLGGLVGVLFATGVLGGAKADPNQIVVNPQPGTGMFSSLLKEQAPPGPAPVPPRGPVPEAAKWLPAETEFVVHVRPADILQSPLVKDLLTSLQWDEQVEKTTAELGIKPTDIESVTAGVAELDKVQQQMQQAQLAMMTGGPPPVAGTPAIVVVKLKKRMTYDDLLKASAAMAQDQPVQKVQHAGKEYLETADPRTSVKGGAYLASDTLLVFGESGHLKKVMEAGANPNPVPNFGFVDWTDHLTLALAPHKPETLKEPLTLAAQQNPMVALALAPLAEGTVGFSLGLTVKGGVEAEIAAGCVDAAKTDLIAKSLTDLSNLGRGQYEKNKGEIPPWAVPLTDFLVSNLKVSGSNRVVTISTSIPDSAKDQLVQLPGMIMTQMMMSAMMGGGGSAAETTETSLGDASGTFSIEEGTNAKAASAEGLPEGFELSASLQQGFDFDFDPQAKKKGRKLNLTVQLEFNGPAEKCVIGAVGGLKAGEAQTAGGRTIKLSLPKLSGDDRAGQFQPVHNFSGFGTVHAMVGTYELEIPAEETEPLASATGSFRYVTGKKSKLLQVKDVRSQAGKEISDPELKAAGLEIKLQRRKDAFGESEVAIIYVKKGYLLSAVQGIDASGNWSFDVFSENGPSEQLQVLTPGAGETKLKEGVGFQAFLYSDLKEVEVPFRFENLELPQKNDE